MLTKWVIDKIQKLTLTQNFETVMNLYGHSGIRFGEIVNQDNKSVTIKEILLNFRQELFLYQEVEW